MTTISLVAPSSAGVVARVAPRASTSASRPGLRFHTVTSKPARTRLAAMKAPMVPKPMKPTRREVLTVSGLMMVLVFARDEGRTSPIGPSHSTVRARRIIVPRWASPLDAGTELQCDRPLSTTPRAAGGVVLLHGESRRYHRDHGGTEIARGTARLLDGRWFADRDVLDH